LSDKEALLNSLRVTFPDLHLWMSEWTEMKSGRDTGMDSALTLANTIHEDLTLAGVNAWQYWIAVSKYDYRDGLLYVDQGSQIVTETKRLWTFGNFSRFIRPGFHLISAIINSETLKVSAFIDPAKTEIILVVINPKAEPREAKLIFREGWYSLTAYETSYAKNLEQVYKSPLPEAYSFPGYSVTTLLVSD
jgi:O-glycosyl hydrolase